MNTLIVCISGFTEEIGERTGMAELWAKLLDFNSPETVVQLEEWNRDWKNYARFCYNGGGPKLQVIVVAYSWGAGFGFRQLARHFNELGMSIRLAYLIDPVYRSRTIFGRWLAFAPNMKIKVPETVIEVMGASQMVTRLRGHEVVAKNPEVTQVNMFKKIRAGHTRIDELPAIHNDVYQAIESLLHRRPRNGWPVRLPSNN